MSEPLKKSHSQIISSPFLLRFSGKLNQLTRQGTLTHQSQNIEEATTTNRKYKTTILQKNGQNSLMSLDQIMHKKEQQLQSSYLHSSIRSGDESIALRSREKEKEYQNNIEFVKSVYLHGKNISQDFQDMLNLLNKVEKIKNFR